MRYQLEARANVLVEAVDVRTGRVLSRCRKHNLVTNAGLDMLANLLIGAAAGPTHGAVGTDNTAPAAGDTTLGTEVLRDTLAQKTKTGTGEATIKFVVGSQQANGYTLAEAGLFDAASGGNLFARVTPTSVAKTDSILVIYTWTVTVAVP